MKSASAFTVIVAFVCLSLVGVALVPLLPVRLNPSATLPGFTVSFSMPGTSARVVEAEVTSRLESMLTRISGVKRISSQSSNGSGSVTVELDRHADLQAVRFEASTIVRQVWPQLPQGVSYPGIQLRTADKEASRPFMTFTLNAPGSPIAIQQWAEDHIRPRLSAIAGVYQVSLNGATPMEWRLEYDSQQLAALGVTVEDIRTAVSQHYQTDYLGIQALDNRQWIRLALVPDARAATTFDPSAIVVTSSEGRLISLDELVKCTHDEQAPTAYFRINGLNSIYLSITAEDTANQLQLGQTIGRAMDAIRSTLPAGYEVFVSYDATEYIRQELRRIIYRTALTVLILLLFVWAITRRWRYLLLIVSSLVVCLAVSAIFYFLLGLEMQIYSLAGITISLNLIIDSIIVMADHVMRRHNLKAFLSVLAATLTTMGALVITFFLDEKLRLNLQDFSAVVMINLGVSLLVSLFFVPALMDKLGLAKLGPAKGEEEGEGGECPGPSEAGRGLGHRAHLTSGLRARLFQGYGWLVARLVRYRWALIVVLVLAFGLPVFLLPKQVEGDGFWAGVYNRSLGSKTYQDDVKPIVDKVLGGTLRLFVEKVYQGSYLTDNQEVVLTANATLPHGSTLQQMDALMQRMEAFLAPYLTRGVKQYQTQIFSANRATINIYFQPRHQHSSFPYELKNAMTNRALELGGGSWSIYGLEDQGFSNDARETAGMTRIKMYGYNYDDLYRLAEQLRDSLLRLRRIREVLIRSDFSYWKDDYEEYVFDLDRERMAQAEITASGLYATLSAIFGRDIDLATVPTDRGTERIRLSSRQSQAYDVWALQHFPLPTADGQRTLKLSDLATVSRDQTPREIAKENQQYRLCLQYEYVGTWDMGNRVLERELAAFRKELPMGYTAEDGSPGRGWSSSDNGQYSLLGVVIAIIFLTTSVLFNSLRQPLAVIFLIPVSFIGVFLTFYLFRLNFDQGGFASFVLLCGLTVNAGIYVLGEFNDLRKSGSQQAQSLRVEAQEIAFTVEGRSAPPLSLPAYLQAFRAKITPILLTVVSTVLGFIPFMVSVGDGVLLSASRQSFWFPLAAGTIGGLLMSLLGLLIYLPVFALRPGKVRSK